MFAGIGGFYGPFHMLRGGKRNIDGVDHIRCQHLLVGTEGMGDGKTVCNHAGFGMIPTGDGADHTVFRVLYRRNDVILSDFRR